MRESPKPLPKSSELVFGENFVSSAFLSGFAMIVPTTDFQTDHMLTIPWNAASGWGTPKIVPCVYSYTHFLEENKSNQPLADGPLALEPSSVVLQYAQTLFEGMKAYRNENGKVMFFRPDMNMKRMNSSAARLALPVTDIIERNPTFVDHPRIGIQRGCAHHPHERTREGR